MGLVDRCLGARPCDLCQDGRATNRPLVRQGEPTAASYALCDRCLAEAERHPLPVVELLDTVAG